MPYSVWQAFVTDGGETVVQGASVTVYIEASGAPATLYDGPSGAAIANPQTSAVDGLVRFYVPAGLYKIEITKGALTKTFRHIAIGEAAGMDVGVADGVAPLDAASQVPAAHLLGYYTQAEADAEIAAHAAAVDPHGDRSYADTAIATAISALVDTAPGALDTLNELAAALGDDANFASTMTTALAGKQATLFSGTNLKSVNGESLLGAGDLTVGLQYFSEAQSTSAPNTSVYVSALYAAAAASSNVDLAIIPKGTGAIIGFRIPDSTSTGGNKRGTTAVDFQYSRTAAAQVASGSNAFQAATYACTASGSQAANVASTLSVASGQYAANYATTTCTASGTQSANVAAGNCTASATYSANIGCYQTTTSGSRAVSIGTEYGTNAAGASVLLAGAYTTTRSDISCQVVFGRRNYETPIKTFISSDLTNTIGATTDFIYASGYVHVSIQRAMTAFRIIVFGKAVDTVGGGNRHTHCFWLTGVVQRNGTTETLVDVVDKVYKHNAGAEVADADVTVDDATGTLRISVTGVAGKTMDWSARIELDETGT